MKQVTKSALIAAALGLWASTAMAHHIAGKLLCTDTSPGTPIPNVIVEVKASGGATYIGGTQADGSFFINVPTATDTYTVSFPPPNGLTITSPPSGIYTVTIYAGGVGGPDHFDDANFSLTGCAPVINNKCWMTAGGVKFEPLANEYLAEANSGGGPNDTLGGNVYPSCSAFPGDGGHWNHVSQRLKLHLNGQKQRVIECGNVPGTEPGTDSPVCEVNFIHWEGWGTISPIKGGATDKKVPVYYEGKIEDRAEPGNLKSAKDQPDDVDRYYIKVWYLNADGTVGAPVPGFQFGTYDNPIQITGGNFQIHCSSCD